MIKVIGIVLVAFATATIGFALVGLWIMAMLHLANAADSSVPALDFEACFWLGLLAAPFVSPSVVRVAS
jgi:hypothetical protein